MIELDTTVYALAFISGAAVGACALWIILLLAPDASE